MQRIYPLGGITAIALSAATLSACYPPPQRPPTTAMTLFAADRHCPAISERRCRCSAATAIRAHDSAEHCPDRRRDDIADRRSLRPAAGADRDPTGAALTDNGLAARTLGVERRAVYLDARPLHGAADSDRRLDHRLLAARPHRLDVD
jgi:hypothetical protein